MLLRATWQLDLKGHVYGLLAAHPVAPLVSLHHLDRLNPISPNWLKRLPAVRSLVGASRHDPSRTLQQAICYHHDARGGGRRRRRRRQFTLSVSVSWGYMVHLYPAAVRRTSCRRRCAPSARGRARRRGRSR